MYGLAAAFGSLLPALGIVMADHFHFKYSESPNLTFKVGFEALRIREAAEALAQISGAVLLIRGSTVLYSDGRKSRITPQQNGS